MSSFNPAIAIIVFLAVGGLVFLNRSNEETKTLSLVESTNSPSPSVTPSETPSEMSSPLPTLAPQNLEINSNNPTQSSLSDLIYPSSKVVLSSNAQLELESSENPDAITDWYKEKIRNMGFNAKSFVSTNTNNNVLNKLVGANNIKEIRVEIKRDEGSQTAKISVKST